MQDTVIRLRRRSERDLFFSSLDASSSVIRTLGLISKVVGVVQDAEVWASRWFVSW